MARKLNTRTAESVRGHIQGVLLVKRLQDHAHGRVEMTPTQQQAAQFLLSYVMPKPVQQVEQTGTLKITWAK